MDGIAERNLKLMDSDKEGGMIYLLVRESCGLVRNCLTANFSYDAKTGELLYFGNVSDIPPDLYKNSGRGHFVVGLNIHGFVIKDVGFCDGTSKQAERVIKSSIGKFNGRII